MKWFYNKIWIVKKYWKFKETKKSMILPLEDKFVQKSIYVLQVIYGKQNILTWFKIKLE